MKYKPGLTEGRGYYKTDVLYVIADSNHTMFAEEWCNQHIGFHIQYIQGKRHPNAAMRPWLLQPLSNSDDISIFSILDTITI